MTSVGQFLTRPMGRNIVVAALSVAAMFLFLESRAEWSAMHKWNRAIGDVSLLLLAVSMAIGPLARLVPAVRAALPWRRETGILTFVYAVAHTVIILVAWVEWDLVRLFGFEFHPALGRYVMLQQGFGLANAIGIVALVYGLVLTATSNNISQRLLGGGAWKFVQRGAYVLWALVVVHTAYFLFLHFLDFHRPVPQPNWLQWPFAILVLLVLGLQSAAFLKTWRGRRSGTARQDVHSAGLTPARNFR